jgi:hypothetical protein
MNDFLINFLNPKTINHVLEPLIYNNLTYYILQIDNFHATNSITKPYNLKMDKCFMH